MKKLLLIGLILAILLFAFPQGVMAVDKTSPVTINAVYNVPLAFEAKQIAPTGPWNLKAGDLNFVDNALQFNVTAASIWAVTATDTTGANPYAGHTVGYMTGDAHDLQNAWLMQREGTGVGQTIIGSPTVLSGGQWPVLRTFYSDMWQQVTNTDFGSPNPYHMIITFTCSAEF
jgi:hypothetical protein